MIEIKFFSHLVNKLFMCARVPLIARQVLQSATLHAGFKQWGINNRNKTKTFKKFKIIYSNFATSQQSINITSSF